MLLPIAGSTLQLIYSSDRQPGRKVDAAPAAAPVGLGGWSISDLPGYDPATKSEILPDGTVRKVAGSSIGAAFAVVDPAGATATEFDTQGRAITTVDAVTGVTSANFTWTAAGLAAVTDGSDASLTIGRDQAGNPTSLSVTGTSPMTLTSTSGELTAVFYPNGDNVQLSAGSNGLLGSITDWNGLTTTYAYDPNGRLSARFDPTGAVTHYTRTDAPNTATVTTSNPSGTTHERQCQLGRRDDDLHPPRHRRRHQHCGCQLARLVRSPAAGRPPRSPWPPILAGAPTCSNRRVSVAGVRRWPWRRRTRAGHCRGRSPSMARPGRSDSTRPPEPRR